MEFALYKYTQIREDKTRIIFVSAKGSVFLDITYSPNGKDKKAFIWSLNVKEEYRGKHFARVLLTSAEAAAKEYDVTKIELEWQSPTPKWVYYWYIRCGYREKEYDSGYSRLCKDLIKDLDGTHKARQETHTGDGA